MNLHCPCGKPLCAAPPLADCDHWICTDCGYQRTTYQQNANRQQVQEGGAESAFQGNEGRRFSSQADRLRAWLADLRAGGRIFRRVPPLRVVDFGSGQGFLLDALRRKGHTAVGVEISSATAAAALANGHQVATTLEELPDHTYDRLSSIHVLEHIPDPLDALIQLRSKLLAEAAFHVEVPNISSFQARLFGQRWLHFEPGLHIHHFSVTAFTAMLGTAGFRVERIETFSLEQGLAGWVQSLYNLLFPYNRLFRRVALNRGKRAALSCWPEFLLLPIIGPLAVLGFGIESALGRGAVIRCEGTLIDEATPLAKGN